MDLFNRANLAESDKLRDEIERQTVRTRTELCEANEIRQMP